MAPHSSTLAWKIPWTEEPGRLQSMGSLRVRHDWVTSLSLFTFMHWRRKWQPTPVFLPRKFQGWRSLVGYSPWGRKESDTTERLNWTELNWVTICSDFGAQEKKVCHCFHCFPIDLPWSDGTRCHDLNFLNGDFKPTFSLTSLTFIKRLFSPSLSAIRVVSSAYQRLLTFLLPIFIPASTSSSLAFHMM